MSLNKSELRVDYFNDGPGGQNQNKSPKNVRVTHLPTQTTTVCRGRNRQANLARAMIQIEKEIAAAYARKQAAKKKAHRDEKIHDKTVVRTYDFKSQTVRDHRTGKRASIHDILNKGKLDKLR